MRLSFVLEKAYRMLRWRTATLLILFLAIGDISTAKSGNEYDPRLILPIVTISLWYIFSTSVNDLADEEIDKINLKGYKERPLANKQVSRNYLLRLAVAAAASALAVATVISIQAAMITACAILLSYIYSCRPIRLSARGILAPVCLPIGYILFPLFLVGFTNHAHFTRNFWLLAAGLYVSFIGRIILKDFRDVIGDRKFGKRTFIVRHGAAATCLISAVAWVIGDGVISYRFRHWPLFIVLSQFFMAAILYVLNRLSQEKQLDRQIKSVGLVGRLGNGIALLLLAILYAELNGTRIATVNLLVVSLAVFNAYTAYALYQPLISSMRKELA